MKDGRKDWLFIRKGSREGWEEKVELAFGNKKREVAFNGMWKALYWTGSKKGRKELGKRKRQTLAWI